MNIENKIRANDRSIWVLDQFLWEKRSRNYIDDDGWTHKNTKSWLRISRVDW